MGLNHDSNKVKIDEPDGVPDFLGTKLVAGDNITLDISAGPNKTITVASGTEISMTQEMTVISTTESNYYIPIGCIFFDAAGESTLEVDTGGGFTPAVYGVDYVHLQRGLTRPAAPITDIAIGFTWISGPVSPGWTFRFTWKERHILINPAPIMAIYLSGGVPDYSNYWHVDSAPTTNGIMVPDLNNYQVELWRMSNHRGGKNFRGGKRFVPYVRGATNQFIFDMSGFAGSRRKWRFRICYYNPITGARSPLSEDVVAFNNTGRNDTCGGSGSRIRINKAVWIE